MLFRAIVSLFSINGFMTVDFPAFEDWRKNPPAKYREIFAEIDGLHDEMAADVSELKKIINNLRA